MTATTDALTSAEVCERLGVTTRMIDHVARTRLRLTPGSGVYREWDASVVTRLRVAKALLDAIGWEYGRNMSPWPAIVAAVMEGPEPPSSRPWVTLAPDGTVTYWHGLGCTPGLSAKWQETAP